MYWTLELASTSRRSLARHQDELSSIGFAMRTGAPLEVVETRRPSRDDEEVFEHRGDAGRITRAKEDFFFNEGRILSDQSVRKAPGSRGFFFPASMTCPAAMAVRALPARLPLAVFENRSAGTDK